MPAATPVTIPVAEPTDATDGALLDQVPPDVAFESVVVAPVQTDELPVIAVTVPLV